MGKTTVYKKSKKRKKVLLKGILLIVLITLGLTLIALSPLFNIKRIQVSGNHKYTKQEIIEVTNVYVGCNWFKTLGMNLFDVFKFRNRKAEEDIKKSRLYVKSAKVNYLILSGAVKIDIKERKPLAAVPFLAATLLIDNQGYILDTKKDANDLDIPTIKGLNFDRYELGQALKVKNVKNIDAASKILKLIMQSDKQTISKIYQYINVIDVSSPYKTKIIMDTELIVDIGDIKELDIYKIDFLKEVFFKKLGKEEKGTLNLYEKNPTFIPNKEDEMPDKVNNNADDKE